MFKFIVVCLATLSFYVLCQLYWRGSDEVISNFIRVRTIAAIVFFAISMNVLGKK